MFFAVRSSEIRWENLWLSSYDYESGEYRYGEVQDIESSGSGAEVEVYDYESGEYRTFEMEWTHNRVRGGFPPALPTRKDTNAG